MRSKLKFLILMSLFGHGLLAQFNPATDSSRQKHQLTLSSAALVSATESAPYWLQANNSARLPHDAPWGGLFTLSAEKEARKQFFDYYYGLETQFFAGAENRGDLIQAYAAAKVGIVDISLGMREEMFGLNDSTLSIGDLTYGNNARPIPKVVISTPDWVKAPVLGQVFSFKAYFAHGWFEKDRYQSQAFLHQKQLYIRTQAFKKRLSLIVGLHHNAQWGGSNSELETEQPTGLKNFAKIVLGQSGGSDALPTDQLNALGNHLGSYDLSLAYDFGTFTLRNYWQFIWEDKSGLTPFNWRDGLIGLSIKSKNQDRVINGVNVELIRTSTQDAIKFDDGVRIVEPDNFFNNSVYVSGWTFQQRMIGNSLFFMLNPESVALSKIKNMVNAVNIGLEGVISGIQYRANYISTKNHGNVFERITPGLRLNVVSMVLSKDFGKHSMAMQAVAEWGNYPGRNAGVIITYSRAISFLGKKG